MIYLRLTYNPYLVTTRVEWEGGNLPQNSKLIIPLGVRLQEWVEELPKILQNEFNEQIHLTFIGTRTDYEDVKSVLMNENASLCKLDFEERCDVEKAEEIIDAIYKDIQTGPVQDLKSHEIKSAFLKAKSSEFEVNVVATMSSGKSTLINALLGKKLMPAKNTATTAKIVKIKDVDGKKEFSATAFDKNNKIIKRYQEVTLRDMQELNENPDVYEIHLEGDIEFVSSEGMSLVLVDTPGPNNARSFQHKEVTFRMLEDSDKSLVLYVMNARQLGINDDKIFLDYICNIMKKGGKKSRDRYIFAVNQMDAFRPTPDNDGEDCIVKSLSDVRIELNNRDVKEANIFPVSAGVALEYRINDEDEELLSSFDKKARRYESMRLNNYNEFSHQSASIKDLINSELEHQEDKDKVLYYSGIRNIEEAIKTYINKYARTTKICDLVFSFNSTLKELATMADLESKIQGGIILQEDIEQEIKSIEDTISNAEHSMTLIAEIDHADYLTKIYESIQTSIKNAKEQFKELMTGKDHKVDISQASIQSENIQQQYEQCAAQINVRVNNIIKSSFQAIISGVISTYMNNLGKLGIRTNPITFSSLYKINVTDPSLKQRMKDYTRWYDEGRIEHEPHKVKIESTRGRNAIVTGGAGVLAGLIIGGIPGAILGGVIGGTTGAISGNDASVKAEYIPRYVPNPVSYIDMNEVAKSALYEFNKMLDNYEENVRKYIASEINNLKNKLKDKISEIDKLMLAKCKALKDMQNNRTQTEEMIAKKKEELEWLKSIQHRVNELIQF
jgi:predicted GTPase